MSDCDLQNTLKQSAVGPGRFMPHLLKSIMRFVPGPSIEKIDGL
jgi:hypothetical protein